MLLSFPITKGNHAKNVLADGMYCSNNNFRYLSNNQIKPDIMTRSNSKVNSINSHSIYNNIYNKTADKSQKMEALRKLWI